MGASTHLEVEPQPVLGAICVLTHINIILQPVVCNLGKADVAALKVTAEGEVA